jgi:dTMP kinase
MGDTASKGILVAIEGIDGAGKTTQVKSLETILDQEGQPFLSTKEPTSGPWGAKIRASAQHGRMSPEEELEAFINDRRQHVAEVIEPALAQGRVVLVDRYYPSTVAYQGARGFDPERLLADNAFAPAPDLLIVLDVEPSLGLQRIRQRGDSADLFEKEDELGRAREIFRSLDVPNLHILDGTRPPESLTEEIAGLVLGRLRRV